MRLLLSLFAVMTVQLATAQTFYVSNSGNDDNTGTSENDAWASIQHSMDNAVPGSTVLIAGGTYNEKVYMNVSGEAGNVITFRNMPGESVVLDGSNLPDPAMIEIYDAAHIRIEGLTIQNNVQNDAIGILVEGLCSDIAIVDCVIRDIDFSSDPNASVNEQTNSQPLIVYGTETTPISQLIVEGCEIYNSQTGFSEALAINGNVEGFEVSHNHVHDNTNIGIDIIGHEGTCSEEALDQARQGIIAWNEVHHCQSPYASAAGIYVDGGAQLLIENNRVYENQWGIEVGCENIGKTTSEIILRNNLIYYNDLAGLAAGGYDYPNGSGLVENLMVRNNTFFANDQLGEYTGEMFLSYLEFSAFRQNIFFADNTNGVLFYVDESVPAVVNVNFDWNLWYHPSGENDVEIEFQGTSYSSWADYLSGTTMEANSIFSDPEFWNPEGANPDLHIAESSPAREAAEPGFFGDDGELDFDGEVRANGMMDIGADEWYVDTSVEMASLPILEVFPNPCSGDFQLNVHHSPSWTFWDIQGKLVMSGNNKRISTSGVDLGVYILKVEGYQSVRVIIQ